MKTSNSANSRMGTRNVDRMLVVGGYSVNTDNKDINIRCSETDTLHLQATSQKNYHGDLLIIFLKITKGVKSRHPTGSQICVK